MTAAVIHTCSKLLPLPFTPAANNRRCPWHLPQITAAVLDTKGKFTAWVIDTDFRK
jgi:hypothetical protein